MSLTAKVKRVTGAVQHYQATIEHGAVIKGTEQPVPSFVEIVETEGGFLLLYFDAHSNGITDSWQPTLEDAKAQAKLEFDIDEQDWTMTASGHP